MFRRRTERKRQRLVIEETEELTRRVFLAYRTPLTTVSLFRCLGQTLLSSDNDWPVVEQNLRRVQVKWRHLEKILGRE